MIWDALKICPYKAFKHPSPPLLKQCRTSHAFTIHPKLGKIMSFPQFIISCPINNQPKPQQSHLVIIVILRIALLKSIRTSTKPYSHNSHTPHSPLNAHPNLRKTTSSTECLFKKTSALKGCVMGSLRGLASYNLVAVTYPFWEADSDSINNTILRQHYNVKVRTASMPHSDSINRQ